jgi:anti-sigma regulatory factor (Ser/Thr protein kinase)
VDVPHDARSAQSARRALLVDLRTAAARGHLTNDLVSDAELLLSELVGNAVRHARPLPGGVVRVQWEFVPGGGVKVAVTDGGSARAPRPVTAVGDGRAESGRGLRVVAALAKTWGVERADPGQRVWAVLCAG